MGDALLMLHALHNAPADAKILVLPQAALLADWQAAMTRAVAHIAPGTEPVFDPGQLKKINTIKKRAEEIEKPVLDPVEDRALARLKRDGVVDFFARDSVVELDALRGEIAEILTRTPPNPIAFIRHRAEDHPDPEVKVFFERWSRHAANAWRLYRGMETAAKT
jgi:hypothetical protein